MNTTNSLAGSHLRTYERIFQHPISHNLEWRDVHALFKDIAHVEAEHDQMVEAARKQKEDDK